jgi:hypothetical protein
MMRLRIATCAVLVIVALTPSAEAVTRLHTSCPAFEVDLGHVEGYDLNYHSYAVEVHGAACKSVRRAIASYLHGRGRHLGGNHTPTELNVEDWDVIPVDRQASGQRGSKWFRASYALHWRDGPLRLATAAPPRNRIPYHLSQRQLTGAVGMELAPSVAGARASGVRPTVLLKEAPVDASYRPRAGLRIVYGGVATCEPGSDSVGNAYRCFAGNLIHDPCWTDAASSVPSVLCQYRPWESTAVRLTLRESGLAPFYEPSAPVGRYEPWAVQLSTGERCVAAQGAHDSFRGRVVDYGCQSRSGREGNRYLLRGIQRSHGVWRISSATYHRAGNRYSPGPILRIATAWYAVQDEGDAQAARANSCSASALAYAALQYETSNGSPDGPLPRIVHHACAAGFAAVQFLQEVPAPGYNGTLAFHATPTGWAISGSTGYLEAGQFGIPEEAYMQISAGLLGGPGEDAVTF